MDATEKMGGPPQRTETPRPAAGLPQIGKPSGGAAQPALQHADHPGMAANGSGEASTAGQPGVEPEEAMRDAIRPWGTTRRSRGRRPLGDPGPSRRRKRAGGGATTGPI